MGSFWTSIGLLACAFVAADAAGKYYGVEIGDFINYAHAIKGTVYAVDENTFFIKGFGYDGTAPDAFFWVGTGPNPTPQGKIVPYPANFTGREPPKLEKAQGENILLDLPSGFRISDFDYLSVYCREYTVNFGHVVIKRDVKLPEPTKIDGFATAKHGVKSASVTVVDDVTLNIPSFSYDGKAPDAFFIAGKGPSPSMTGNFIKVPDERKRLTSLRQYTSENIKLELPPGHSLTEFDWLSVYCESCAEDLGHITFPASLIIPPSFKETKMAVPPSSSGGDVFDNCVEPLEGVMQVRWKMDGEDHVLIQMMAKIKASTQYMAFGLSGAPSRPEMINGDVTVGFYDAGEDAFKVEDYFLSHKAQCDGKRGVCPDTRLQGENDSEFVDGEIVDGVTSITFRRPLAAGDARIDTAIPRESRDTSVIAAIGTLNDKKEANYHSSLRTGSDSNVVVNFAGTGLNTCGKPLIPPKSGGGAAPGGNRGKAEVPKETVVKPWKPSVISGVNEFQARIGPTGDQRGYEPITGHPSWGIAWWINGMLIPEIYVERGKTYKFTVEGGDDPKNPARSHPLYITDNPYGGFGQKQDFERAAERVYAGVGNDSRHGATAMGRLCEYVKTPGSPPANTYETFEEYSKDLKLQCDQTGVPGQLVWTVRSDTPDELYYQCYTHRNMGWKIHVRDAGFTLSTRGEVNGATSLYIGAVFSCLFASFIAVVAKRFF